MMLHKSKFLSSGALGLFVAFSSVGAASAGPVGLGSAAAAAAQLPIETIHWRYCPDGWGHYIRWPHHHHHWGCCWGAPAHIHQVWHWRWAGSWWGYPYGWDDAPRADIVSGLHW